MHNNAAFDFFPYAAYLNYLNNIELDITQQDCKKRMQGSYVWIL